jgi:hypothetical protein
MPSCLSLPDDVHKQNNRWIRECPFCGSEISHLRRNYCVHSSLTNQPCKKCSNKNKNPAGMIGAVRVSWYNSFLKSAITRGYEWELTPEFIDAMHEEQDGQCAYSGLPIAWSDVGWDHTASIDRIDNDKGYTEDNVQLVHKDVNMMRGSLDDEKFKQLCIQIANNIG